MNYKIKTLGIDYSRGGRRPMVEPIGSRDESLSAVSSVAARDRLDSAIRSAYAFGCAFLYASISCAALTCV